MSNFSFFHSVFKRLLPQTRKNQGLFGKGLSPVIYYGIFAPVDLLQHCNIQPITKQQYFILTQIEIRNPYFYCAVPQVCILNPLLNSPDILQPQERHLLQTLWEKEKMLVTSILSFSHNVLTLPTTNLNFQVTLLIFCCL